MRAFFIAFVASLLFVPSAASAQAPVDLGDAESFGALSATAMTNAGANTVIGGNVGSSTSIHPGVTAPGFALYGPGSAELAAAQASLLQAYGDAEAAKPTGSITGVNLSGKRLKPGVYNSTSAILLSGPTALTLDGQGSSRSVFIFQAGSDLTVDPTSSVRYVNGAQPCNVFWKVNSAFLKNTGETFVGTILALTQITLTEDITVQGRLLARNADVTFIHDRVTVPTCKTKRKPKPVKLELLTAKRVKADGKPDRVRVRVGPAGVKATIRGAGVNKGTRSNSRGVATWRINPRQAGVLVVTAGGEKLRIGSIGSHQPQLTG